MGGSGRSTVYPMFTWAPYWVAQDVRVAEMDRTARWKAVCTPLVVVTVRPQHPTPLGGSGRSNVPVLSKNTAITS